MPGEMAAEGFSPMPETNFRHWSEVQEATKSKIGRIVARHRWLTLVILAPW
jgi:hypothetical protein